MGIVNSIKNALGLGATPVTTQEIRQAFPGLSFFGSLVGSGSVPEMDAFGLATYTRCRELIGGTIASCRPEVKMKTDLGYVCQDDHPLTRNLFRHTCNDDAMLWMDFVRCMIGNSFDYGDGIAFIDKDPLTADVVGVYPLLTKFVSMARGKNNDVLYLVTANTGQWVLRPDQIVHIKGLSTNGYTGKGILTYQSDALQLGINAQKFGSSYFKNGAMVGGFLESTFDMTPAARQEMIETFRTMFAGSSNAFKVGTLPKGMKFNAVASNAKDAEIVETRKYQDLQIARVFGVPPAMVGIIESGDKNTEQQSLNFYKNCLLPITTRFEAECEAKLLKESEKATHRIRFNVDDLLRADAKTRSEVAVALRNAGLLSQNDYFASEGKPLVADGDDYLRPLNMTTDPESAEEDAAEGEAPDDTAPTKAATTDVAAFSPIVRSEVARLISKEANAIGPAMRRQGEAFPQWVETFYRTHGELAEEFFAPVVQTIGQTLKVETRSAKELAAIYIAEQRSHVPNAQSDLEAWKTTQTNALSELLLGSIIDSTKGKG